MAGQNPHRGYDDPHAGQPVITAGANLEDADAAVVMAHGRGATAEGFVEIAQEFDAGDQESVAEEGETDAEGGVAYLAPQARGRTWYPNDFRAPIEENQPGLSSALGLLGDLRDRVQAAGIPPERTMFVGFSQGACLSSEFVARNAREYGGLVAWSGGVIGPDGTPRDYGGSLDGTPVFVGCSDSVPQDRLEETRDVFEALGGEVEARVYEGMAHTVNRDEIGYANELVAGLVEDE